MDAQLAPSANRLTAFRHVSARLLQELLPEETSQSCVEVSRAVWRMDCDQHALLEKHAKERDAVSARKLWEELEKKELQAEKKERVNRWAGASSSGLPSIEDIMRMSTDEAELQASAEMLVLARSTKNNTGFSNVSQTNANKSNASLRYKAATKAVVLGCGFRSAAGAALAFARHVAELKLQEEEEEEEEEEE